MKKILTILILVLLAGIPMSVQGQKWNKEEQAFLDHFKNIWQEIEDHDEATFEIWSKTVNPQKDITWWFTNQAMPYDLDAVKKWHQNWGTINGTYTFLNIRPIEIKILNDIAMIWFYSYGEWVDKAGKRESWEDQRLEIYQKKRGNWEFVGGMVNIIEPR